MLCVVGCLLFVVCCLSLACVDVVCGVLFDVYCSLCGVCCSLLVARCALFVVCCVLAVAGCLLFDAHCLPNVMCCLLVAVCRVLFEGLVCVG